MTKPKIHIKINSIKQLEDFIKWVWWKPEDVKAVIMFYFLNWFIDKINMLWDKIETKQLHPYHIVFALLWAEIHYNWKEQPMILVAWDIGYDLILKRVQNDTDTDKQ